MRSLRTRILFSASLVLLLFLGLTSVLLDQAFRDNAENAVEDRLRGRIFMLIGAADFDSAALVNRLPEPSLSIPVSGQYARILDRDGEPLWASASMAGVGFARPAAVSPGQWQLNRQQTQAGEKIFVLTYPIIWEGVGDREPQKFVLQAAENDRHYLDTVNAFRRSLWLWFAGLSVALLVVQALTLSRGLRPLAQVGEEVRAIEQGKADQITGAYPSELSTLTRNLNRLLQHNRASLKRYRHSLGDLAHSIKTPLAILRNVFDNNGANPGASADAREQIARIDRTVQYYLDRSAAAGRVAMAPPIAIRPVAERILGSLKKVYADRALEFELDAAADVTWPIDEGDLMEVLGNLADNACKWARRRVVVSVQGGVEAPRAGGRLVIEVIDDGPGMAADQIETLTRRGTRLDESVEGHGIGLAIVRDMVEQAYGGSFEIRSGEGLTCARAEFTQT